MSTATSYIGYIRVSTVKQGEHGVSLQAQREAILAYAQRHDLKVTTWFEERITAAKRGRPAFQQMLQILRRGRARGLIVHKIDRSARNLFDWAQLQALLDQGVELRFANEDLDLHTRGGRLSADIQAVVAADYTRNLREEAPKGIRARLKQGIYPFQAPFGYLNQGAGKPKLPDPDRAPLVRRAFQLYATGQFSLTQLREKLGPLGLTTPGGHTLSIAHLAKTLRNPFYMGIIKIRKTGETYPGAHDPTVSARLFQAVQDRLDGKVRVRHDRHSFLYSRLFTCGHCKHRLIGELQKGKVYYRCHTHNCQTRGVREDTLSWAVKVTFAKLQLSLDEKHRYLIALEELLSKRSAATHELINSVRLRSQAIESKLGRLTDLLIDGTIDKAAYNTRREQLLQERQVLTDSLSETTSEQSDLRQRIEKWVELSFSALSIFKSADQPKKRELLETLMSNRVVTGKTLAIELFPPFSIIANRPDVSPGGPSRRIGRTCTALLAGLVKLCDRKAKEKTPSAPLAMRFDLSNPERIARL